MVLADEHIKFKGKNGNILNISECITDMQAYQQLNDSVSAVTVYATVHIKQYAYSVCIAGYGVDSSILVVFVTSRTTKVQDKPIQALLLLIVTKCKKFYFLLISLSSARYVLLCWSNRPIRLLPNIRKRKKCPSS